MGHGDESCKLGQLLIEEHQCPSVNCMHTQSLVGHAQVDNTVLQAARNVAWRKMAVELFARKFECVGLRDECFVAMLALMDRMTVCGTLAPRDEDEVFAEWLAAVLVIRIKAVAVRSKAGDQSKSLKRYAVWRQTVCTRLFNVLN